jgi:hypothetical protein
MNNPARIQRFLVIFVLSLNAYCIYQDVKYKSALAIYLAIGSILALLYCIRLIKKLRESEEEENY